MSVDALIQGFRRGTTDEQTVQLDKANQVIVSQGYPFGTELTRRGLGYQAMTTSALAALVVRPSTVAMATLHNLATSPYHLVIQRAVAFNLVSTTAEARAGIWLCSHPVGQTAPTNDITVRNSTAGKAAGDGGHTIFDAGATVADDGWFPWGDGKFDVEPSGVLPGAISTPQINGLIIVPPGGGISGTVVSSVVGNTYTFGFHWFAVPNAEMGIG